MPNTDELFESKFYGSLVLIINYYFFGMVIQTYNNKSISMALFSNTRRGSLFELVV